MRKFLGVISAATLLLVLAAAPASARSNDTITMTCTGGQVIVSDAHSRTHLPSPGSSWLLWQRSASILRSSVAEIST